MTLPENLRSYLAEIRSDFRMELGDTGFITLYNSGQRGLKSFQTSLSSVLKTLKDIEINIDEFIPNTSYIEEKWRDLGATHFSDLTSSSLVTVQTKPVFTALTKLISWANQIPPNRISDNACPITKPYIQKAISMVSELITYYIPKENISIKRKANGDATGISKPFILLAGISGTGKTKYIRDQARYFGDDKQNYCLIPVRPDWHEPSDLLGYLSHISGSKYVVTELLFFIVSAWKHSVSSVDASGIKLKDLKEIVPFWLCLDEMNLAPVEQYFADFLSVLETRKWTNDGYSTEAIVKSEVLKKVADREKLREDLGLIHKDDNALFEHFFDHGIPLPPNLIVAGTVNMDETTHGFSRKVIDRALTIDFGCFFPNNFNEYFKAATVNKSLSFPVHTSVDEEELKAVAADSDGQKSINFLSAVNAVLKDTPFELAFRALNELLISVVCFNPKNDKELQAVWDDFLMMKVLPRIDGDAEKLRSKKQSASLLDDLSSTAQLHLTEIWDKQRPDLLRENKDGTPLEIDCHSKRKIQWMSDRLALNSFTSFWP